VTRHTDDIKKWRRRGIYSAIGVLAVNVLLLIGITIARNALFLFGYAILLPPLLGFSAYSGAKLIMAVDPQRNAMLMYILFWVLGGPSAILYALHWQKKAEQSS
jgi:hypothetical protein